MKRPTHQALQDVKAVWMSVWPQALEVWSRYTRLGEPRLCHTAQEEKEEGLTGSFAMIRLNDQTIVISLLQVIEYGIEAYGLEILAHEIGHHVFTPGDLLDAGRALALTRRGLPTVEEHAPMVLNLYEDLLINDRLVRVHELRLAEIFEILARRETGKPSSLWSLYLRVYEILWGLSPGRLGAKPLKGAAEEGDAQLAARMVRVYADDWVSGAGGFATLCLPYLLRDRDEGAQSMWAPLLDATGVGAGSGVPLGLTQDDTQEILHPSRDPKVVGLRVENQGGPESDEPWTGASSAGNGAGQTREPYEYGQILKALGLDLTPLDAAVKYYRERALPNLIPFPVREAPESTEPLMEGLDSWDIGSPLDDVDWLSSILISPKIFPGYTTVQRSWGKMTGRRPKPEPVDLDLYVDCSGSMPDPQHSTSYLTLAGAIVVLSALRVGAKVQATLWSGARQFDTTKGFIRDEQKLLRVLTGYFGGGTAFPNHLLRTTYERRTERDRPVHILILSDEGVDTMAQVDEKGVTGIKHARMALEKGRAGGTMVLNLYNPMTLKQPFFQEVMKLGWQLFPVSDWEQLVAFSKDFARRTYGQDKEASSRSSKKVKAR